MSHDSNRNVGKGPFVYKQTYLANFLGCLMLWFIWLFLQVITYRPTVCKCLILMDKWMTRQCMHGKHKLRWGFSCGNCNS